MKKTCIDKEYRHIFVFNGEELEADECYSSRYGSYCRKDNITYENVSYKTEYIKCNKYSNLNDLNSLNSFKIFIFLVFICFSFYSFVALKKFCEIIR